MFSLYKVSNTQGRQSPKWHAQFYVSGPSGGRVRRRKSTGTTDRSEANEIALEWFRTEQLARKGMLTASKARDLISEVYERHSGEKLIHATLKGWADEWIEQKRASLSPKSMTRYDGVVRNFLARIEGKADCPISQFTISDAHRFRSSVLSTGKSNHSVNLDFKIIGSMFRVAHRGGVIPSNPFDAVESLPNDTESHLPFTLEQVSLILSAAEGEWKGLVTLGFTTGGRLGDLAALTWESVDLAQGLLKFRQSKTRRHLKTRDVEIPLHPMLKAHLERFPIEGRKGFIHPSLAKIAEVKGTGGRQGLSRGFMEIMERAGIVDEAASPPSHDEALVKKGGRKGRRVRSRLSFHSFRHTLTSILHNAGVAPEVRQKITGHASLKVHQIYTHTELSTLRDAMELLPSVGIV